MVSVWIYNRLLESCANVIRLRSRSHIRNPNRHAHCSTFTSWRVWTHEHFFTKYLHRFYLWHQGGLEMGLLFLYEMYRPGPLCEETLYWIRGVTNILKKTLFRGEPITMLHSTERVGSLLYLYQPWVHCGNLYCHQMYIMYTIWFLPSRENVRSQCQKWPFSGLNYRL